MADLFEPAIHYASEGFPVSEIIASQWQAAVPLLSQYPASARTYLIDGKAPCAGDVHRQPNLARTLQLLAAEGREAFYGGEIARRIVEFSQANGGFFTLADFAAHTTEWVEPISTDYRGYTVLELPPNGQGITALIALNILEGFDLAGMAYGSAPYYHLLIEATKQAFADRNRYVADPACAAVPVPGLLSKAYAAARRQEMSLDRAGEYAAGEPVPFSNTVYVSCVDRDRNVVSLIYSLFMGFGSGVVAGDTGICLHNRGAGFVAAPAHPNALAPGKRPFHTIIPAMILHARPTVGMLRGDGRGHAGTGTRPGRHQPDRFRYERARGGGGAALSHSRWTQGGARAGYLARRPSCTPGHGPRTVPVWGDSTRHPLRWRPGYSH